jgi:hypothetical protein
MGNHAVRANRDFVTDLYSAHHLRDRTDIHAVADDRHAGTLTSVGLPERDALADVAVAPDADTGFDDYGLSI